MICSTIEKQAHGPHSLVALATNLQWQSAHSIKNNPMQSVDLKGHLLNPKTGLPSIKQSTINFDMENGELMTHIQPKRSKQRNQS